MDRKKYSMHDFKLLSVFGYGNYSKVALVRRKDDDKIYAMKVIKKKGKAKGIVKDHAFIQKDILMKCSHPFIIKMHTTFQDQNRLFFILEYCPGGQLFGLLKRMRRFSEQDCRFYVSQVLLAIEYLHSLKIIYRDLKLENIVIDHNGYIRLIDFGLSVIHHTSLQCSRQDVAGTIYYLAPEVFDPKTQLSYASDWWSFGSLIFQMIMGFPPFYSHQEDMKRLIDKIKNNDPPLQYINSQLLRDFLKLLLEKDPKKRLGAKGASQIKKHPWMIGVDWQRIINKVFKAPFIPKLSSDCDIVWFQDELQNIELSPTTQGQLKTNDEYNSFSISWRSSSQRSPKQSSPVQIIIQGFEQQQKQTIEIKITNSQSDQKSGKKQ